MDTPDWLKGMITEGCSMDTSSPSGEIIACSRPPPTERRLRPQHEHALKCPRCESTHTKFCYYNNYSLSQPRYFCKTCRRYWTKGGSLRNVPVGGGCRKKRSGSKKPPQPLSATSSSFHGFPGLQLSFPGMQLQETAENMNFMEFKYNPLLMESSLNGFDHINRGYNNGANCYGFSADESHGGLMEACQRLALPFGGHESEPNAGEVKHDWQEQGFSGGLGLWSGAAAI